MYLIVKYISAIVLLQAAHERIRAPARVSRASGGGMDSRASGEAVPSIDAAKKIADALEVNLDYLVGEGINSKLNKKTLKRLEEVELLEDDKKSTLFDLIDTYIRDAKTRKAHTSQ